MSRHLIQHFVHALILVVVSLVLFGVVDSSRLLVALGLFLSLRLGVLIAESLRQPIPAEAWERRCGELARQYRNASEAELERLARECGLTPPVTPEAVARAEVAQWRAQHVPPRSRPQIAAEALGLLTFGLLLPLNLALFTREIVSLRSGLDVAGALVLWACLALYGLPRLLRGAAGPRFRTLWWTLPALPAVAALLVGVGWRHPYLNPFGPERHRLAAERVLSLSNNVKAAQHADWVLRYARRLDEAGDEAGARQMYRAGLRLDVNDQAAQRRLAVLEGKTPAAEKNPPGVAAAQAGRPLVLAEDLAGRAPRCSVGVNLGLATECTVVLVAAGELPEPVLDVVSAVVYRELGLKTLVATNKVGLPPHTRRRGLMTGPQWDANAVSEAFFTACRPFPQAPVKYVVLTPADIYTGDNNYVFSGATSWGAVVSLARLGDPAKPDDRLLHRTAKQTLCALIKSFGVPMSSDRSCVTSYVRSLPEFDEKGDRPSAETLALLRDAVAKVNFEWDRLRAASVR